MIICITTFPKWLVSPRRIKITCGVELKGTVNEGLESQPVAVEIKDSEGSVILIRTATSDANGEFD